MRERERGLGSDLCTLKLNFFCLSVHLGALGVDLGDLKVDPGALGVGWGRDFWI